MTTPSKGAMRAAKKISREGYDGSDHGNVEPWKEQDLADVATIIDRETRQGELLGAAKLLDEALTAKSPEAIGGAWELLRRAIAAAESEEG